VPSTPLARADEVIEQAADCCGALWSRLAINDQPTAANGRFDPKATG
jgi:hypothetical protein